MENKITELLIDMQSKNLAEVKRPKINYLSIYFMNLLSSTENLKVNHIYPEYHNFIEVNFISFLENLDLDGIVIGQN